MELYTSVSRAVSRLVTNRYSTSFGLASQRFDKQIRTHIYAIYGLTRIADEIVDSYSGKHAAILLDELEVETYKALQRRYSANPIVHAFQATAHEFGIDKSLITPFFKSMRMDLTKYTFSKKDYKTYIYGSAEVVGLMCLKVFCEGDHKQYEHFKNAAAQLGAAYQKVNFLRDIADDYSQLGRYYFPDSSFDSLDEAGKNAILEDIRHDFQRALPGAKQLPRNVRAAVLTSYRYYAALYRKLQHTPIQVIKTKRLRINNFYKLILFVIPLNTDIH